MAHSSSEWEWWRPLALLAAWLCFSALALAAVAKPDTSVGAALQNLASRAGVAFIGRVAKIKRDGSVVDVTFLVEEPLVGNVGATYTLREWAGLWPQGESRYTLGQRVAIFLHAPGKSGLSSPVDGMEGIVPVVQESAEQAPLLDVRRLAARVQRSVGEPLADESNGAIAVADAKAMIAAVLIVNKEKPIWFEPIRYPLPIGVVHRILSPIERVHDDLQLPVGIAR
jgi:hypothetical protein